MELDSEVLSRKTEVVSEVEFTHQLKYILSGANGIYKSVTGPGRSGAIAAVYASHFLKIPFIPYKQIPDKSIAPLLIIDTAMMSGRTLRKAYNFYLNRNIPCEYTWVYSEPPKVKFWYEMIGNNFE